MPFKGRDKLTAKNTVELYTVSDAVFDIISLAPDMQHWLEQVNEADLPDDVGRVQNTPEYAHTVYVLKEIHFILTERLELSLL